MHRLIATVTARVLEDRAQDLIEYALLAALIAVVAVGGVTSLGAQVNTMFGFAWPA